MNYVKIMPEFMANPIWDEEGLMMSWADLALHDDHLLNKLVIWNNDWEREQDTLVGAYSHKGEIEARGLRLAMNVKHCKPDWTVMYYTEDALTEITHGVSMWRKFDAGN